MNGGFIAAARKNNFARRSLFSPRAFSEKRMGADRCEISKKSIGKSYIGGQTERIFYKNYVEI